MKQVLEVMDTVAPSVEASAPRYYAAREALRAAIEQAQEPVAWISESENLLSWDKFYDHMTPLYTAPRNWQGLTDEEIERACVPLGAAMLSFTAVARAIEAKLKEKNT
jgi:hypothetical protein